MIEVSNLCRRYGRRIAVDNVSFHLEKGQIYEDTEAVNLETAGTEE